MVGLEKYTIAVIEVAPYVAILVRADLAVIGGPGSVHVANRNAPRGYQSPGAIVFLQSDGINLLVAGRKWLSWEGVRPHGLLALLLAWGSSRGLVY